MIDSLPPLTADDPERTAVLAVAERVRAAGGRALLVGGWVRDALLTRLGRGVPSKDLDVEVFGIELLRLEEILAGIGPVDTVGASFAVLRVRGVDVDFSLPRRDVDTGAGHRGFLVHADPRMTPAEAARRRDFTINSISVDPLSGELVDPVGGRADLASGLLRATDRSAFGEDPLRALRAVQFAARFVLRWAPELPGLMAEQDLAELPSERLEQELRKLLLRGVRPSRGLALAQEADLGSQLPALGGDLTVRGAALDRWVPMRPVDPFSALAEGWTLLLDQADAAEQEALLERVGPPARLTRAIRTLRRMGLPAASRPALRGAARELGGVGLPLASLLRVADAEGRPVEALRAQAEELGVLEDPPVDAVLGRHVLARGVAPGPAVGEIVRACRELQDTAGVEDAGALLDAVLGPARTP